MTRVGRLLPRSSLLIGWIIALAIGAGAQVLPAPAEVLNRTYRSECGRDKAENLKVRDGKFSIVLLMMDGPPPSTFEIRGSAEIRFAGDKRSYIAVFAECSYATGQGNELFLLRRTGKNLVQVGNAASTITGFGAVKFIKQASGIIVVGRGYRQYGNTVLPEDLYEFRYRYASGRLTLVDHGRGSKK